MLILSLQTASLPFKNDGFIMEILTFLKNQSFVFEDWFGSFLESFLMRFMTVLMTILMTILILLLLLLYSSSLELIGGFF